MGCTFQALVLGLRYRGSSPVVPPGSQQGSCFSFWVSVGPWENGFQGPVQPTDCLCKALWVKRLLPDLGRGVMSKAVLALFFRVDVRAAGLGFHL